MVDLKYVSNRFKAEKLRSDVDEVIGIVKYNLKSLCTSVSICLLVYATTVGHRAAHYCISREI